MYILAHTNHSLAIEDEVRKPPYQKTTQREISAKLQQGIPVERIMEGITPESYMNLATLLQLRS